LSIVEISIAVDAVNPDCIGTLYT